MQGMAHMVSMPMAPDDGTEPLPPGTTITTILPNLTNGPVAMAFDPSGRLFFTEKGQATSIGQVRLYAGGTLQASPVITFAVSASSERGLLGIALDPNFNANHYIYVYYTAPTSSEPGCADAENRVVRFVESGGVGFNPTRIFFSCQDAGNHNGGNIHFGPDGKLYISVGDNANAANAQNVGVKNGKMHRINPDGTIPSDNPVFTQTGALPSLYVMGVRNTFDFVIDPLTAAAPYPRIFASENGPSCDDEMNRIEAGYNYGWRASYPCDDPSPSPTYNTIAPLWFLPNGQCCDAPTGITVYTGQQIPEWHNELFMAAFNNGNLRHFYLNSARTVVTQTNIVQGISAAGDIETGPDGALWFFQESPYSPQVNLRRLSGTGPTSTPPPPPPTATRTPSPGPPTSTFTPAPPTSTFTPAPPTDTPGPPTETATSTPYFTPTVFPTATACTVSFSDVPAGSTFYPFVHCLACQGIINGYPDGTFRPNNNVSRGQLTKIVSNSAEFNTSIAPDQQTFEDVPPGSTFYTYTERLSLAGVMEGYPCGSTGEPCVPPENRPYFRPSNNATRGQIAKIISNAAGFIDDIPPGTQTFQDVPEGSTFYTYTERLLLNRPNVMSGYPCGGSAEPCVPPENRPYFRPNNNATRGQTSKIVSNTFFPDCVQHVTVTIEQFSFHPPDITIKVNTVVRFINRDLDYHTATADDSSFDTGRIYQNQYKDIAFGTVGDFGYYCIPHPFMRGVVHVIP
jgi:glucose/arabinose dehydrogenase/plastocyanin